MALKADVAKACRMAGTAKPIDLVHLSTVTMGDPALEREVLTLFHSHVPDYIEMLETCADEDACKRAVHTIKGAARGIGAFKLAETATECEEMDTVPIAKLSDEIRNVEAYIASILSRPEAQ